MIDILQGSVVTQTALGGLTIYPSVANLPKLYVKAGWQQTKILQ